MSRWDEAAVPRGDAYDARWREMEALGQHVHGEADFVAGLAPATVLDAGCGTGRVAAELARRGIATVGVDRDPAMLATARANAPDLTWVEGDLSTLDLADRRFDVVVAAGNVMVFLAPGTEAVTVARLASHLEPRGRLVAGFGITRSARGLDQYDRDCRAAGLTLLDRFATWDRRAWEPGGDYAVSVHRLT